MTRPEVQGSARRVPLRMFNYTWPQDQEHPQTWRGTVFFVGGAVLECAKALHRIADALEAGQDREEDTR